jgi:DNA polymerase III subunit delta'
MTELYEDVIGQTNAVAELRAAARRPVHAYLFVGPAGTGKSPAAASFAASLLCPTSGEHSDGDVACDSCRRVLGHLHPDVIEIERDGAFIRIPIAQEVVRTAYLSPVEGRRKVIILRDFHLIRDAGPAFLKTIEEPPDTTVFIVLAEYVPPDLVTIASRCVQVEFGALSPAQIVDALVESGVEPDRAAALAEASGGRLERARLLATDPQFEARRRAWHEIPTRLDGHGATAAQMADELVGLLEESVAPLKARHADEAQALLERNTRNAEVVSSGSAKAKGRARATKAALNSGVAELEERQKREQRRQRTDELRTGLAILAAAYRDRMQSAPTPDRRRAGIEAVGHIDRMVKSFEFNPGELLALQALLARLGRIA